MSGSDAITLGAVVVTKVGGPIMTVESFKTDEFKGGKVDYETVVCGRWVKSRDGGQHWVTQALKICTLRLASADEIESFSNA